MADKLDLLGAGLDVTEPVAGADLLAPVKKPSAIVEGFRGATAGAKASLAGFGALAASSIGADTVKQAALQTAAEQQAVAEEHARRVEDVASAGDAWEHYKYLLGSAAPTLALMLAGGLAGRGLGAVLSRGAPVATRAAAMRAGSLGGAVVPDVALESGEIYTSALAEGTANPELRAAAGGALAASLDFIPLLAAERYLRAAGRGGFGAAVKGAAKGAPVGAALEGGQEAAQAVIERGFAGKSLTDGEALSDYLNSFLGGAAPGVLFGGATGVARSRAPVQEPGPAPLPAPAEKPLPEILGANELNAQASDTALLGSFADAQGGVVPQPLSTTGPQLPATEAPSRFNRAQALVAEDADLTDRAILADQRDHAQARLAEIGTLMESASRRDKALLQREAEALAASIPALDTQIGVLDTQIGNRARMAVQPEVPAAAPRSAPVEGVVLGETMAPDTTEAERAIAETKRALGLLVSSREAQLAPLQSVGTSPQVQTVSHQPRSSERQPDQKTLTGAMIEAGRQVAAQDLPKIVKTRAEGVLKKPTPEQDKARERAMRDAVDSVITEAAALPSVEAAQAHVLAELPKAVKGRVDAKTAGELADRVSRGLAQAPRYYSKAKVDITQDPRFQQWFSGSQVVDAQGSPLRVYKGMNAYAWQDGSEITSIDRKTELPSFNAGEPGVRVAGFFSSKPEVANVFAAGLADAQGGGSAVYPSYLNFKRPFVIDARGQPAGVIEFGPTGKPFRDAIRSGQYDGVIIKNTADEGDVFVALDPASIKSAISPQKSMDATNAAQDVYDQVMEQKGQDAIKRFQFLYGEHGETFDIFAATAEEPNAGYYQAMQDMKDIIGFAFNANNLPSVADHEAFHALEQRKLDARERAILSRALRPGQPLFEKVVETARRYDREQQTNLTDEILSTPAEARAYAYQFWRQGELQPEGAVATIFAKIKEFLQRVANALRGQGFQSVEDIYRAIDKGAYATRARREGGTIRRNVERDPADPRFAPDFETFRSLMTLKWGSKFDMDYWSQEDGVLRFPYELKDGVPARTGLAKQFLQDVADYLDLNQLSSYITVVPHERDTAQFGQEQRAQMYERRGWVRVVRNYPQTGDEKIIEMWRDPQEINDERIFGQARESGSGVVGVGGSAGARQSLGGHEQWYYSALTRAIEGSSTKSASPEGWRNVLRGLKGVKPDEIKWSGLEEWLALQSGRVTQEQVVSYLRENGVRVEEVTLGDMSQSKYHPVLQEWEALVGELEDAGYSLDMQPDTNTDSLVVASVRRRERLPNGDTRETTWLFDPDQEGFNETSVPDWGAASGQQTGWKAERFAPPDADYEGWNVTTDQGFRSEVSVEDAATATDAIAVAKRVYATRDRQERLPERILQIGARLADLESQLPDPNDSDVGDTKFAQYQLPGGQNYRELLLTLPVQQNKEHDARSERIKELIRQRDTLEARRDQLGPGAERQDVIRQIGNTARQINVVMAERDADQTRTGFRSSHFDQPNILAHVRFNERTDAEGKRVLFVEEFQSDWAQKGKKEGFFEPVGPDGVPKGMRIDYVKDNADGQFPYMIYSKDGEIAAVRATKEEALEYARGYYNKAAPPSAPFVAKREFAVFKDGREQTRKDKDGREHQVRYGTQELAQQAAEKIGGTVRDMGYGENTEAWVALALKRMIRYASEHGFDKIAWTTGEQQVTRYREALQKHVDRIEWEKTKDGVHLVGYKGKELIVDRGVSPLEARVREIIEANDRFGFDSRIDAREAILQHDDWRNRWSDGLTTAEKNTLDTWRTDILRRLGGEKPRRKVVDTRYAETELSDAIGKAMADRIHGDPAQSGVIEGQDITVSDTGMAAFYDRIVPNVANDVLRKLGGGKVGETQIATGEDEQITYFKNSRNSPYGAEGTYNIHFGDGRSQLNGYTSAQIREMFGEQLADEIFSDAGHNAQNDRWYDHNTYEFAGHLVRNDQVSAQHSFTLTPQMRQAVMAGGLPLFSKAAVDPTMPRPAWLEQSGRDIDRLIADGQVPREQKLRGAAQLLDEANLPDTTFQQMLGYSKAEMGTVKEFWHKHFASGNYLSRFSQGYKNVQQALSTFTQRKSQLFAHALNVQLSDWVNANDTDIQATSDAIFKATVGSMQKGSPEYMTLYGSLTPKQQEMFRQVFGDKDKPGVIADMLWKEFEADSRDMQAELPPAEFAEWAANRRTRVQRLIQDSYVPERRYGDYTVKIFHPGADGKNVVLFYEQYESRGEAALAASRYQALLKEKGVESLQVEFGTRHQNDRDTGLSLRQFFSAASRHGVALTAAERQRIARALVSADSARMNRIMQRKNIPGHSQDGLRVLSEFALTMASKIAHSEFTDAIEAALTGRAVDTQVVAGKPVIKVAQDKTLWQADGPHSGFYRNLADRLADFVLSPPQDGKWAQQLKAAGTLYFLGGNLSFGLVNLTSLPMNTVPWLSAHAPYTQAFATVLGTFKTVVQNQKVLRDVSRLANRDNKIEGIEDDLRSALVQAAEDGTTLDTEIHHLMGLTKGQQFTNSRRVQKAMDAWMLPFRMSEQLNRITTFSAAYRIGRDVKKLTGRELYKFAQDAVASTQGRYDEANRPGFGQSPLWSTLFMFKSFPIFMIEMLLTLHKQSPAAAVKMLLGLTMAAGITGLPFAEDLMDILDVISQRLFGSSFNTKRAMRNVVKDASEALVGADLSNLVLNGAVNDWLGVNLSTRVGLGNLIPGTRLGAADNDYKRTLEEVLGPAGGMLTTAASGLDHLTKLEFMDALKAGAPVAARNVLKGAQQLASGEAVDTQGRKLLDVNGWEAFWQTLGFSSSGLNKLYQMDRLDRQAEAYYTQVKEDFAKDLVRAVREGDSAAAQATMEAVQAWNEAHPEMPIGFAAPLMRRRILESGLPLNERTLRNLPRQLRGTSTAIEGMQ